MATEAALAIEAPDYIETLLFGAHRYKVMHGGRGGTKSWTVARALLMKGAQRKLRIGCFRELQSSIKDSVHQLLVQQIALLCLEYSVTEREIRHPRTGTIFIFEGLRHNTTKIKSMEGIDIAWVEEAERVSEESWKVLIPTVRAPGSQIWVTFNPDLEEDATYQRFIVHPPPNAWVHRTNWEDNPWFPDELRQDKDWDYAVDPDAADHTWGGNLRRATAAQVLRGKWVVEEFEPFTEEHAEKRFGRHWSEDPITKEMLWDGPYFGADFGFSNDPTVLTKVWIHDRTLYVEREAFKVGLETDETAEHWEENIPGFGEHVVRADSARPETISYLRRHGAPHIVGAPKWEGSIKDGIKYLRQFRRIVIHPRCRNAVHQAKHYNHKVNEAGDVLPEIVDKHNDTWDAVRYALAPLIRQRSRPPQNILPPTVYGSRR